VTGAAHAVFLSYASQDAAAALHLADALGAAGIEVWIDKSVLRGGDAWDAEIRRQIKTCALFVPIISANAHARVEGYFRLEWKLAIDRSHLMSPDRPFLLPVVIDDTRRSDQRIPERFRELHWSHLPHAEATEAFIARVRTLLTAEAPADQPLPEESVVRRRAPWRALGLGAALLAAVATGLYFGFERSSPAPPAPAGDAAPEEVAFAPPAHSIAVLPFVNMSGDAAQEYFSDGLSEELINSLSRVNELQVAASTSTFSFKGTKTEVGIIARRLNVGTVLEGSVRRSAHTVRITAQLVNAITGFHLWSQTYDRDLVDVLAVQTEIANAVAGALKITLLGDVTAKVEMGGTHDPGAFDAYLRATRARDGAQDSKGYETAIAAYSKALELDPHYALAFAGRSVAYGDDAQEFTTGTAIRAKFELARADAQQAIALAPDLAEGHLALAAFFENGLLDFAGANDEYERAVALARGNAAVLRAYARFARGMGRGESAIDAARRAVLLDPLNVFSHTALAQTLFYARRYQEAIAAYDRSIALDAHVDAAHTYRGFAYYELGDLPRARAACEINREYWNSLVCLAITYQRLGLKAQAAVEAEKLNAQQGESAAFQFAEIHAQWAEIPQSLSWLEKAMKLRDPGLADLKSDPFLDPLRHEPRFLAIQRALKFPGD
jgi:TolB-like protein/tetratricopeptide (TPR) repeat protein